LDWASARLPLGGLLAPFRTASYALLVSDRVMHAKRIVGLTPEASSFGLVCLSLLTMLWFFRRGLDARWIRDGVAPPLLLALAACVWLSTSSAAYVGLAVLGLAAFGEWVCRVAKGGRRSDGVAGLWCALAIAVAVLLAVVLLPQAVERALAIVDRVVLQKSESYSFRERSSWTAVSWDALLGSWGIGVGVGSTRASNAVVAVVASTGVLGGMLYYGFILQTAFRRPRGGGGQAEAIVWAVPWALLPPLADGLLIGVNADFGPVLGFIFALSAGAAFARPEGAPGGCAALRAGDWPD